MRAAAQRLSALFAALRPRTGTGGADRDTRRRALILRLQYGGASGQHARENRAANSVILRAARRSHSALKPAALFAFAVDAA